MELREQLLVAITKASVEKNGVQLNNSDVHAEAIVQLADAIVEKMGEKK